MKRRKKVLVGTCITLGALGCATGGAFGAEAVGIANTPAPALKGIDGAVNADCTPNAGFSHDLYVSAAASGGGCTVTFPKGAFPKSPAPVPQITILGQGTLTLFTIQPINKQWVFTYALSTPAPVTFSVQAGT
jgi:hypothetical protein